MIPDDRMFILGGSGRILYFHRRVDYFRFEHLMEKYAQYVAKSHGRPLNPVILRLVCHIPAAILLKDPMHRDWKKWRYENQ